MNGRPLNYKTYSQDLRASRKFLGGKNQRKHSIDFEMFLIGKNLAKLTFWFLIEPYLNSCPFHLHLKEPENNTLSGAPDDKSILISWNSSSVQREFHSMKFLLAVYMHVVIKDDYDLILWPRS